MRVNKIQNSCYGEQEKRANRENRNSRVAVRIKNHELVIATVSVTDIITGAWSLPTCRIRLPPPHPGTHQVLPGSSNSFRICKHWYLVCLFWSFTFVPETVSEATFLPLCPKSPFPGAPVPCQPHNTEKKAFLCLQLSPGTGNDWFAQFILGKIAQFFP